MKTDSKTTTTTTEVTSSSDKATPETVNTTTTTTEKSNVVPISAAVAETMAAGTDTKATEASTAPAVQSPSEKPKSSFSYFKPWTWGRTATPAATTTASATTSTSATTTTVETALSNADNTKSDVAADALAVGEKPSVLTQLNNAAAQSDKLKADSDALLAKANGQKVVADAAATTATADTAKNKM